MAKPTVIAFVDLQMMNGLQWDPPSDNVKEKDQEGWFLANENHAEVHLVAMDGTFRQIFFSKGAVMRIVGNTIWFNADDTDYLVTDHNKKYPTGKNMDDSQR